MTKKLWEEVTFRDFMKQEISKGKTAKEKKKIEQDLCLALMSMNCTGLQKFNSQGKKS